MCFALLFVFVEEGCLLSVKRGSTITFLLNSTAPTLTLGKPGFSDLRAQAGRAFSVPAGCRNLGKHWLAEAGKHRRVGSFSFSFGSAPLVGCGRACGAPAVGFQIPATRWARRPRAPLEAAVFRCLGQGSGSRSVAPGQAAPAGARRERGIRSLRRLGPAKCRAPPHSSARRGGPGRRRRDDGSRPWAPLPAGRLERAVSAGLAPPSWLPRPRVLLEVPPGTPTWARESGGTADPGHRARLRPVSRAAGTCPVSTTSGWLRLIPRSYELDWLAFLSCPVGMPTTEWCSVLPPGLLCVGVRAPS